MLSWQLPDGDKVDNDPKKELYSLDLTNVPPLPDEDWMPPLNTLRYRVKFYFTTAKSSTEFWADAAKRWAKDMEETIKSTGGLRKIASDLVAPGDTEIQKAQKIYEAVEKLDNTRFSREKTQAERKKEKLKDIKTLEDVWKQKSGSDAVSYTHLVIQSPDGDHAKRPSEISFLSSTGVALPLVFTVMSERLPALRPK